MPLTGGEYWLRGLMDFPRNYGLCWRSDGRLSCHPAFRRADRAGIVAGIVGALPGFLLFLPVLYTIISGWIAADAVISVLLVVALSVLVIFGGTALLGFIGGHIGGWVATTLSRRGTFSANHIQQE